MLGFEIVYAGRNAYPDAVTCRLRHRSAASLRLIAYAILALALLVRPVLASLGEMHELAHDPSGSHLDISSGGGTHHDELSEASEGSEASALHTLLHFAHCCGQLSAAAVAITFDAANPAPTVRVHGPPNASVPMARWQTPFRPPITT